MKRGSGIGSRASAGIAAVIMAAAWGASARAQVESDSAPVAAGLTVRPDVAYTVLVEDSEILEPVDVQARYEAFERDFAEEFGVEGGSGGGADEITARLEEALAGRWEGSAAFRWYERLEGVYGRAEGLYNRLEHSTRWAVSGFSVDPDMEAAIDGKVRLNVQRKMGGIDMGFDVDDAVSGKLGLRLGGTVRGFRLSFDLDDIVAAGRVGFQLRRLTP